MIGFLIETFHIITMKKSIVLNAVESILLLLVTIGYNFIDNNQQKNVQFSLFQKDFN